MKFKKTALILFFFICTYAVNIHAETGSGNKVVMAEGFSSSRSDALLKAKRSAVEQGIGMVLLSHTEVQNYQVQKDVVLTRTIGSVKKYTILKEEKQSDDVYYIKIEATVSLADIKADLAALKILLESMDRPRMMVLIKEDAGQYAENAILDYLGSKEFDLVDASVVAALMESDDAMIQKATEGDPVTAAKIGVSNNAEYIITGKVRKSSMENSFLSDSGMKSGQASITAKVINCSNARIIASKSATGAAVHTSLDIAQAKAVEKAAKKLMSRKLFEKVVSSFQSMVNNGMTLEITVKNVADFKTQKKIKKIIGNIPDVVSVSKRSFGGGKLKLTVLFKGDADSFSEAIDGQKIGNKKASVTDIAGSRIIIGLGTGTN